MNNSCAKGFVESKEPVRMCLLLITYVHSWLQKKLKMLHYEFNQLLIWFHCASKIKNLVVACTSIYRTKSGNKFLLPLSAHSPRNLVKKSIIIPHVNPTKSKVDI